MSELNIYESIYKNALTGSIVIIDAQNLIGKLELNGTERISFKLSTPGAIDKRRYGGCQRRNRSSFSCLQDHR